ncbi:MAG TPA: hypothetical protein VF914_01380 [Chloroflexia bacterium]|jgi:hypothetical protein
MQLTDESIEFATVTIMILLFVGLLAVHVACALWVGMRDDRHLAWKRLGKLSFLSGVVWVVIAAVISFMNLFGKPFRTAPTIEAYGNTFGIPFGLDIPGVLLGVPAIEVPGILRFACTAAFIVLVLFILSIPFSLYGKQMAGKSVASLERRTDSATARGIDAH